ncbi:MAG: flagellar FlbD family protein [Candidatus Nanopelagicales bacterium]
MIVLTRLSGAVFALNCDLIERVDMTPDTVITLVDGAKYVVMEELEEVVAAVRAYRGAVIAESACLTAPGPEHDLSVARRRPSLSAVPGAAGDHS